MSEAGKLRQLVSEYDDRHLKELMREKEHLRKMEGTQIELGSLAWKEGYEVKAKSRTEIKSKSDLKQMQILRIQSGAKTELRKPIKRNSIM